MGEFQSHYCSSSSFIHQNEFVFFVIQIAHIWSRIFRELGEHPFSPTPRRRSFSSPVWALLPPLTQPLCISSSISRSIILPHKLSFFCSFSPCVLLFFILIFSISFFPIRTNCVGVLNTFGWTAPRPSAAERNLTILRIE